MCRRIPFDMLTLSEPNGLCTFSMPDMIGRSEMSFPIARMGISMGAVVEYRCFTEARRLEPSGKYRVAATESRRVFR